MTVRRRREDDDEFERPPLTYQIDAWDELLSGAHPANHPERFEMLDVIGELLSRGARPGPFEYVAFREKDQQWFGPQRSINS